MRYCGDPVCDVCAFKPTVFGETKLCEVLRHGQNGFVLIVFVEHVWKIAEVITLIVLQNIISHADIFPFSKSCVDHVNHGTKNIWLCRCFVNFSGGEVVFLLTFCGIAVFRAPPMPPRTLLNWDTGVQYALIFCVLTCPYAVKCRNSGIINRFILVNSQISFELLCNHQEGKEGGSCHKMHS